MPDYRICCPSVLHSTYLIDIFRFLHLNSKTMPIDVLIVYGSLLFAMAALWSDNRLISKVEPWIPFAIMAVGLGWFFGFLTIVSILYVLVFGGAVYLYYKSQDSVYFLLVLILTVPLLTHLHFNGFHNYRVLDAVSITEDAVPFSLYFNFDKTLIGLFIIGFGFKSRKVNNTAIYRYIPIYLVTQAALLMGLALILGYTRFDVKIPGFTLVWALINIFFVCHAEEALFRGLIQKKLETVLNFRYGRWFALFIASLLFGLAHYKGGAAYVLLASVSGLFYGHIFQKMENIASSILLHFFFNLLHLLLFTYPALAH